MNFKEMIKNYKKAKSEYLLNKISSSIEKILDKTGFLLGVTILFIGSFLINLRNGFSDGLFGLLMWMPGLFILFGIIIMILSPIVSLIVELSSKQYRIKKEIYKNIYKGEIYDLFDKDCPATETVLKRYKKDLSKWIYLNKGLHGFHIVLLVDEIYELKKDIDEKNRIKEALTQSSTKIGDLLRSVENI